MSHAQREAIYAFIMVVRVIMRSIELSFYGFEKEDSGRQKRD